MFRNHARAAASYKIDLLSATLNEDIPADTGPLLPSVAGLSTHKPQGSPTWPVLYDSVPVQRPYKQRLGTHAKTFSASLAQQDVIVGTQFDGNSRLLFNLPSAGWKLPPIRPTSANARRFFSNTVTRPQLLATTTRTTVKAQTLDSPAKKHEVPKPLKKLSIGEYETGATVTAAESQKPCFVRSRQRSLVGFEEKIITGVDLRSCLTHCLRVSTFFCASVNYNEFEKHCTLNGGNLHLNDVQLRGSTSDYYENECSPVQNSDQRDISSITTRSTATEQCFDIFAQSMLLNLESHLERAPSLEQCKVECLKRTVSRSPPCGALNWIPHIQSCMLFEVGYDKRLIMPSSHGQFLVNKCAGNVKNSTGTDRRFSPLRYEKVSFSAEGTA
nr:PAN-1 domain containing protein [Haemonchus contortus]